MECFCVLHGILLFLCTVPLMELTLFLAFIASIYLSEEPLITHFSISIFPRLYTTLPISNRTRISRVPPSPPPPILRSPVLYLDETKSPRFPPFFVCSQIQINCELEIAGRWPWMVMWISPGFSSRVASAVRRRQSGVFEVYETCRASIFWQCVRIWGLSQRCFIQ